MKIIKTSLNGREQILRFLGPGEIFNEIGVFAKRTNPATALALEKTGIWHIPRTALEQILFTHPQTALLLMENMADLYIDLVALTADLSMRTVDAHLTKLLLEQAEGDVILRRRWTPRPNSPRTLGLCQMY